MGLVRVFIVTDSLTFSNGLKGLLLSEPGIEIINQETNVNRAIDQIEKLKPDVIIWAITGMKRDAGEEEIRLLQATHAIKTISLNLQNTDLIIHQETGKTIRVLPSVQNFITVIKDSLFPPAKPPTPAKILPIA